MKKLATLLLLTILSNNLLAQESAEKVMEKRAREMHRVLTLDDKEQWKKFIRENYTQALIDQPIRRKVQVEENGNVVSSSPDQPKGVDNVENKAMMFSQLHDDFGDSKITSLKVEAEALKMVLQSPSGFTGKITLKYSKEKPYLIDGLGVEVEK